MSCCIMKKVLLGGGLVVVGVGVGYLAYKMATDSFHKNIFDDFEDDLDDDFDDCDLDDEDESSDPTDKVVSEVFDKFIKNNPDPEPEDDNK